jgi:phosphohistidine swiveling domain-containing protein
MKQLKIKDWMLYGEYEGISWFHSCYMRGLAYAIKDRLGYGLSQIVAIQEKSVQKIYISQSEWTNIGGRFLNDLIKNPKLLEKLLLDLRHLADKLKIYSAQLKKVNFSKLSSNRQLQYLKKFHELHHDLWAYGQVPNVLELENSFLTDYLKAYLAKSKLDKKQLTEAFQALVMPRELSEAQKEERAMLALAGRKDFGSKSHYRAVLNHFRKYSWLHFGWMGPSLTKEYFIEVCHGLHKQGEATKNLKRLIGESKLLLKNKKFWIKEAKVDKLHQQLFRLLEELLFIKAHRMDALFRSYEASQPLLTKIALDHHLSLSQIYNLYYDDLVNLIKTGKPDAHYINETVRYSVGYFDSEKIYLLVGEKAKKLSNQLILPKPKAVDELAGQCGYPGLVKGEVCIVNHAREMAKFKDGQILVSIVTDPSLLPIMKKASAFVTNQGGLTCHAAIVAREMKTPCVIGTKIATQVFKDGDMVEVDAENGIVKKMK